MGDRTSRRVAWLLAGLFVLAVGVRLYRIDAPLLEQMYVKQVYVANKARNIAVPPLNPLRSRLDFLADDGQPMTLTEEVPLYTGLLGLSYRLLGEREWLGRAWSLLATLVCIGALYDLFRREFDRATGLVAAAAFAFTPLSIFYGRAVLPDPFMVAAMLLSACAFRRYLDDGRSPRWLAATAAAGLAAAMFKYYGLMIVIPLAEMAWRADGRRGVLSGRFAGLLAALTLPIAAWMVGVFLRTPNPTSTNPYTILQTPGFLLHPRLYERLTLGFLVRDCGPIVAVLMVAGIWAAARRGARWWPLLGWSVMGLAFYFLFAPKLMDHDYYELMMLPGAAGWAAVGWKALFGAATVSGFAAGRRARLGAAALAVAAVVQSPWLMKAKYEVESIHAVVARRIAELCPPDGRMVVMGQQFGWAVVHYSGRQGWVEQARTLPTDWEQTFQAHRDRGAEFVALYFDPTVTQKTRQTYRPLIDAYPVVEHETGPWFRRGRECEYYILDLRGPNALAGRPVERR